MATTTPGVFLCSMRVCTLCAAVLLAPYGNVLADAKEAARAHMVREIEADARATQAYIGKSVLDTRVMAAMAKVPRHEFVPPRLRDDAYANRPLPIGYGQTISQPYIVALMTDLLNVDAEDRVLEIGTGSGYQAAILAEVVTRVHSIEIIGALGREARARLQRLGYKNVTVRVGDGYHGWKEHAPYAGIIVTAAAGHIPPPLLEQLEPGGRMLIPIGTPFVTQQLTLVEKNPEGKITTRRILPVRFVPLTGEH